MITAQRSLGNKVMPIRGVTMQTIPQRIFSTRLKFSFCLGRENNGFWMRGDADRSYLLVSDVYNHVINGNLHCCKCVWPEKPLSIKLLCVLFPMSALFTFNIVIQPPAAVLSRLCLIPLPPLFASLSLSLSHTFPPLCWLHYFFVFHSIPPHPRALLLYCQVEMTVVLFLSAFVVHPSFPLLSVESLTQSGYFAF